MKKLVFAAAMAVGCLGLGMQTSVAAPARTLVVTDENARMECILPWYRFLGSCPEAIDDTNEGHSSNFRRWHPHGWRH